MSGMSRSRLVPTITSDSRLSIQIAQNPCALDTSGRSLALPNDWSSLPVSTQVLIQDDSGESRDIVSAHWTVRRNRFAARSQKTISEMQGNPLHQVSYLITFQVDPVSGVGCKRGCRNRILTQQSW